MFMLLDNIKGMTMLLPFFKKNGDQKKDVFPKSEFINLASYHKICERDAEILYKSFGNDPTVPVVLSKIACNGESLEAYAKNVLRSA
jgi:hypothetical protein